MDVNAKTLELQMVNADYIKSAVELLRWRHKHSDGERTLLYRADQVVRLLHTFDGHWREAYRRVMNNAEKLKEQTLHSAVHEILASNVEKEPKAADKAVQPDKRPKTKRRPPPPPKIPDRIQQWSLSRQNKKKKNRKLQQKKLRLSERLLARKASRKD